MLSAKCQPFCSDHNVLNKISLGCCIVLNSKLTPVDSMVINTNWVLCKMLCPYHFVGKEDSTDSMQINDYMHKWLRTKYLKI